ncbi:hypothetical protein OQA88_653 [Cercophora sp. LCS_1]
MHAILGFLLALCAAMALCITERTKPADNVHGYIVVGGGPGGAPVACNLARAGHSVLLMEAGDDGSMNTNSQIASLYANGFTDPKLRWDFFARNHDNDKRTLQHNQLVWRHGFTGYLDTVQGNASIWHGHDDLISILQSISASLNQTHPILQSLTSVVNFLSPARDKTQGVFSPTIHTDPRLRRSSSRDYILSTLSDEKTYPLHCQLNTLATRVLFDNATSPPRATGISYLPAPDLYRADPLSTSSPPPTEGIAYARKEVILSAGSFNSPQLVKLPGIGPRRELQSFGIPRSWPTTPV